MFRRKSVKSLTIGNLSTTSLKATIMCMMESISISGYSLCCTCSSIIVVTITAQKLPSRATWQVRQHSRAAARQFSPEDREVTPAVHCRLHSARRLFISFTNLSFSSRGAPGESSKTARATCSPTNFRIPSKKSFKSPHSRFVNSAVIPASSSTRWALVRGTASALSFPFFQKKGRFEYAHLFASADHRAKPSNGFSLTMIFPGCRSVCRHRSKSIIFMRV
mmetsp:Transcript_33138/g.65795  ORF Transcript_33138/g.65795 Transcript_33138/m.65795 type:complete len:221 (-) Transcript_33138:1207-1869(-)